MALVAVGCCRIVAAGRWSRCPCHGPVGTIAGERMSAGGDRSMRTLLFSQTTLPSSVSGRFRRRRLQDHAVGRESAAATRPEAAQVAGAGSIVLGATVAG